MALVVIENVPGLLTSRSGQDFATILADLDDLGYTVSWTTVGACRVGACHHRHRVFIAATLVDCAPPMSDPVAHRAGAGWVPAQSVLFGDMEAVRWPASGFTRSGTVWELPAETCGVDVSLLPTPRTVNTKSRRAMTRSTGNGRRSGGGQSSPPGLEEVVSVLAGHWPEHMPAWEDLPPASQALLPTPKASDTGTPGRRCSEGWRPPLSEVLLNLDLFPTPTARIGDGRGSPSVETAQRRMVDEGRRNLEDAVALLPTPVAGDAERASSTYSRGNPTLLGAMLPTPRVSDTNGAGQHGNGGIDLRTAVSMFPTPTARDSTRGAGRKYAEGRPLSEVIALLPTPVAGDAERVSPTYARGNLTLIGALQPERFGKYAAAVARHEVAFGLVAPEPTEPGRNGKPRLSPAFPEFLQGLPPGWLTDVVGRNDALKLAGNGVNPRQGAYALGLLPTFRAAVAHLKSSAAVAV